MLKIKPLNLYKYYNLYNYINLKIQFDQILTIKILKLKVEGYNNSYHCLLEMIFAIYLFLLFLFSIFNNSS